MLEQQLTAQAAEIAAAGHAGWGNTMLDAVAELAALRKDAERYRWLRDDARGRALSISALEWRNDPALADIAVDAAIATALAIGAA